MIITDKFVYIHMPKTGGTFVETVLRRVHEQRGDVIGQYRADRLPRRRPFMDLFKKQRPLYLEILNKAGDGQWNQHGRVYQIPAEHAHKPVLTTLRNPFDRCVSEYEFEWWKQHPLSFYQDPSGIRAKFPNYPDVTFEEFVYIANMFPAAQANQRFAPEDTLGRQTIQFIRFFYPDPARLAEIDVAYLAERRYNADVHPNLRYTFMHDLNRQLYDFLLTMDYAHEEIAFIVDHEKIFPEGSKRKEQKWERYYTPALRAYVRHHERMLFEMFPQFDEAQHP